MDMKQYIMTIGAFIMTFVIIFVIFSGVIERIAYIFPSAPDTVAVEDGTGFGVPDEWLKKHNVILSNFIDAKRDIDHDGLTILQEYEYHTDPNNPDTDGDGYADGIEVNNGYSPSGTGLMDTNSNNIPDKWEIENVGKTVLDEFDDSDNDGLTLQEEYLFGTNPQKADTDGDGYNDGTEIKNGYDPTAPGEVRPYVSIAINAIDVDVPVVLSMDASENALQKDLEHGVIHYPKMAMPGQRGNVYIAGHSSNYVWSKGSYNYAFKRLNNLENGDVAVITTKLNNGKKIQYKYIITLKEEVAPDDARIFADTQSQELTLTTCWPLGTNVRRLMIKAHREEV